MGILILSRRTCVTFNTLFTRVIPVLTKGDRARLDQLIRRLSCGNESRGVLAEEELLRWCLHQNAIFETLKKRKHDTTISAETRSQLQNIVVITRSRKNNQIE